MSDIGNIKPVNTAAVIRGNSLPVKSTDGKTLPPEFAKLTATVTASTMLDVAKASLVKANQQKNLDDAIGSMNDFAQNVKRDLQFSVDKELNQTVIKVVDSSSGKLIRQIPEDIFLELARKVKESGELNLLNATG